MSQTRDDPEPSSGNGSPQETVPAVLARATDGTIRVLLILSRLQRGGLEQVLLDVARSLSSKGFQFRVVALTGPGDRDQEFRDAGVEVLPLAGHSSLSPFSWRRNLRCLEEVAAVIEEWRPQVVQCHHFFSGVLGRVPAWSRDLPVLQAEHNFYLWKGLAARLIDTFLARGTTAFLAPSRAVACHVARTHGVEADRVHVIPNGLQRRKLLSREESRDGLGLPRPGVMIGFLGRLTTVKGPEMFLETASELAATREDLGFVVIGSGPLLGLCWELAVRPGLRGRAWITGPVPDAASMIPALDLLVSCSSEEGFGLAVAEAILAGVPVVVPALPAFRELLPHREESGFYEPGSGPSLLAAIQEAMSHREETLRRTEREARELRQRFDPAGTAASYEALYRELARA